MLVGHPGALFVAASFADLLLWRWCWPASSRWANRCAPTAPAAPRVRPSGPRRRLPNVYDRIALPGSGAHRDASRSQALPTIRPSPVGNILVALFAITLCLINAVVWTFVSDMPIAGVGWVMAAAFCFWLQKWSKG